MKALLVIDMQQGSFTETTPRYGASYVVSCINRLAAQFRQGNDVVVFIQHDGTANDGFIPGTEEWALLLELEQHKGDLYVSKTANDCFYRSELEAVLAERNIRELVITGCATDFCVDTTIKAALSRDYDITVIADGHTTADRSGLNASGVIAYYNWIWQEMLPTGGSLRVMDCGTYLEGR